MGLRRSLRASGARAPALAALALVPAASAAPAASHATAAANAAPPALPAWVQASLTPTGSPAGAGGGSVLASATGSSLAPLARARPRIRLGARALNVVASQPVWVRGALTGVGTGTLVSLQARDPAGWRTVARARTNAQGRFDLRARRPVASGRLLRVRFAGDARFLPATRSVGRVQIYRVTYASWYGPGSYGTITACGRTLTPSILGVAHRTLPCGTRVSLRNGNRTVYVPVIDRGPYVSGREWDLTTATAQRLGFDGVGPVLAAL